MMILEVLVAVAVVSVAVFLIASIIYVAALVVDAVREKRRQAYVERIRRAI